MNARLLALGLLAAQIAAVSLEPIACSPRNGSRSPVTGTDAGAPDAPEGGPSVDATVSSDAAPRGLPEASCFGPMQMSLPDASHALVYGSCIPRVAEGGVPLCYESGHVGDLPDAGGLPAALEANCTNAPVEGTWSTEPCDRSGIVFGCQADNDIGDLCVDVTTTWYYPPATRTDEQADCPPPLFVVFP